MQCAFRSHATFNKDELEVAMKQTVLCVIIFGLVLGIDGATTNLLENPSTNVPQHRLQRRSILSLILLPSTTVNTNNSLSLFDDVDNTTTPKAASSAEDYPELFSDDVLRKGAIVIVFLIGIYCFTLLALVCDGYFLPCVEKICEVLNLSQDVAAATFMSVATSTPELFVNIIATFVTQTDVGVGTIVGSSLFNTLGVASLGGIAASNPLQLDWWPVTRDVIIYTFSVLVLISITWDGIIYWYEGLILFIIYFLYFTVMFQNVRIMKFMKKLFRCSDQIDISTKNPSNNNNNNSGIDSHRSTIATISHYGTYMENPPNPIVESKILDTKSSQVEEDEEGTSIFRLPQGSIWKKFVFFYTWPLKFVLFCTIPNPRTTPKLFPITFVLCIIWIGINSYVVSWMFAIIGHIFNIPDAVLGLTFLAAGGCLPEAISITIMSRRGEGSMGVSNSLGANTMNILLSLGMPWFLKTILMGTNSHSDIALESHSIKYTIVGLVFAAMALYLTLYFHKFRLSKRVGLILITIYSVCVILAILSEMVFFNTDNQSAS